MVACGGRHTVVVDARHNVWFCGSYEDLAASEQPPVFVTVWPTLQPSASANVSLVACGFDHSVLVLASGLCLAWGSNSHGQLGISPADTLFSKQPQ